MDLLIILLVLAKIYGVQSDEGCPIIPNCYCLDLYVACTDADLRYIPDEFPPNSEGIFISGSQIEILLSSNLSLYTELIYFSKRMNPLLSDIEVGAFDGLEKLEVLQLDRNNLTVIKPATFAGLVKLTTLDLSYNYLTDIPPLHDLTSLTLLYLKLNELTSVPAHAFGSNLNMTSIDLSYNLISTVEQGAFNHLGHLEYLVLEANDLTDLGQGLFNGLDSLRHLLLRNNLLTHLTDSTFIGTGANMELLELHHNKLVSDNISDNSFAPLTKLSVLHLESNYLTTVPSVAIKKMQNLTEIHLNGNLMTAIQNYSFSDMPLIDSINIGHMDTLVDIALNAFSGTTTLTQLAIYDNKNLTELTLAHLPDAEHEALTSLKIYNNGFTTLQEELFSNKSNPILCESPIHLLGFDIRVMKESDLTCRAPQIELSSSETVVAYLHGNASLKVLAHNGLPHTWWEMPSGEIYNPIRMLPQSGAGFPGSQLPIIVFEEYLKTNTETVVISTLMFSNATQQDAGNYTVYAGNHIGNATMVIYLEVLPYELTTPAPPSTTPITSTAVPSGVEIMSYVLTIGISIWIRLP